MAKGGKRNGRRKTVRSMNEASDGSDEDYTFDEDEELDDESEDGYSSFVGDESEESLGEFEETKKAKKVVRSRAPRRKKNGTVVKPRKRKRVSYREDDDDEDGDDGVDKDDEFRPDCLDDEEEEADEEFPVMKGMNNSRRKGTAKDDDYENDEEFNPDGLDEEEEDESPVVKGMKNSSKSQLCKGTAKDDDYEDDEEFNPDGLDDEEDNSPVVKGMKNSSKPRLHKGTTKDDDYEDDEEFNPDGSDEEEDEFPVVKGLKNSSKPRLHKGTAKDDDVDGDDEYEDDREFTPDGLDEEEDLPVRKGMKNASKSRLRKCSARDDDEEDEDDEEFTLDSLDEEEFPVMKVTEYSKKPRLRRKGTSKQQKKNRNHKELKKITRKKPQKRLRLKRKARSENDKEFIDVDPVLDEKNKKVAGQRGKRKRLSVNSDSDFVASSGRSDCEFTISEEEREQVREASKFCRGLVTAWRAPASLRKSLKEEAPRLQRKLPGRKDKVKVEELKTEAGKQICGICLSEEGKRTVRGTLNCCSHYFCFACIMEWSKVESRCPLCKQRFVTISKPARSNTGFDLRTVVIQVPERDQVYQPSEEELRGYVDPYENVLCTECQQGGDDALMLLCDLCDSPAHTYCVGLGHEVPDGNWYCESCRPTALASSNQPNLNPTPDNRTSSNCSVGSPPNPVLTFDLNEMYVPDTPLAEESGDFQSPRDDQAASLVSGVGAFTVFDRRRIQRQIHQLLNNRWRQLGNNVTGTLGAVSGNSLFGSQMTRSRELASQPAVAQRAEAPHNTHLSHHRSVVPERTSNFSGQLNLNGASTSSQSFFGEFLESELQGADASISLGLVHQQQLHPCSSRSYVGPDTSPSPCPFRESTVPSRTLPSTLRRPF